MIEVWEDIKGYEGLYQISNFGRVKRIGKYKNQYTTWESNKILKPKTHTNGYKNIILPLSVGNLVAKVTLTTKLPLI